VRVNFQVDHVLLSTCSKRALSVLTSSRYRSAGSNSAGTGSSTTDATTAVAGHGHHHGGGSGNIGSELQSLEQQLSSSSSGTTTSTSGTTSSSSATDALQQSFSNLLAANGASGSTATLGSFLQSLSQNLEGASPTGNIVNTVS
jgi:hypothetical protein